MGWEQSGGRFESRSRLAGPPGYFSERGSEVFPGFPENETCTRKAVNKLHIGGHSRVIILLLYTNKVNDQQSTCFRHSNVNIDSKLK